VRSSYDAVYTHLEALNCRRIKRSTTPSLSEVNIEKRYKYCLARRGERSSWSNEHVLVHGDEKWYVNRLALQHTKIDLVVCFVGCLLLVRVRFFAEKVGASLIVPEGVQPSVAHMASKRHIPKVQLCPIHVVVWLAVVAWRSVIMHTHYCR